MDMLRIKMKINEKISIVKRKNKSPIMNRILTRLTQWYMQVYTKNVFRLNFIQRKQNPLRI